MRSLRRSPAKHIDLLPQEQVFRFQRCSRLEARSQDTENQLEQVGQQDASLRRPLAASTPNRIFGTHRSAPAHLIGALRQAYDNRGPNAFDEDAAKVFHVIGWDNLQRICARLPIRRIIAAPRGKGLCLRPRGSGPVYSRLPTRLRDDTRGVSWRNAERRDAPR